VTPETIAAAIRRRLPGFAVDLAPLVAANLAAIAERWPEAPRDGIGFAEHVAERLAKQADPAAAVHRLHVEDLFLAWWAGTGAPAGIAAFEAEYASELSRIASRFANLPANELAQQLRIKLFVGERPKIYDYAGFGALLAWIRVVAVRAFVDIARATRTERYAAELDEGELLGLPIGGTARESGVGVELAQALKRAFAAAVAALAPRQRAFLRHAYVDQLTLDQIAASYSIHRATVARTLASAREQLIEHTREGVVAAIGVAPSELATALGTLAKNFDLSLSRILRAE
jgi:RNA polymerase sigma-70 factor (ECF subfamily)